MYSFGANASAASFLRFLDHTPRRTTLGRTPLNQWSARRRGRFMTTHDEHKRRTFMPPAGFEPAIPAMGEPQTYAVDRGANGIGWAEILRSELRLAAILPTKRRVKMWKETVLIGFAYWIPGVNVCTTFCNMKICISSHCVDYVVRLVSCDVA